MITQVRTAVVEGVTARIEVVKAVSHAPDGTGVRVQSDNGNDETDAACRERRVRLLQSFHNADFTVYTPGWSSNLPGADLAAAAAILLAQQSPMGTRAETDCVFFGELALDGRIRPVRGVLAAVQAARAADVSIVVPRGNAQEATLAGKHKTSLIFDVETLDDLREVIAGKGKPTDVKPLSNAVIPPYDLLLGDGPRAKLAEITAALEHGNVLLIGSPGSGKTMMARRAFQNVPSESRLEVARIYSAAGLLGESVPNRVFRAPHHTISEAGMLGGGAIVRPGEITLAHGGVLFLDELAEFRRPILEGVAQAMRQGSVSVYRKKTVTMPVATRVIGAMNPCPCGYKGTTRTCSCSDEQIKRYMSYIDPVRSIFDTVIEVPHYQV